MQYVRLPAALFNSLYQMAASAPIPYAQSQAMWKALEQIKPETDAPAPNDNRD